MLTQKIPPLPGPARSGFLLWESGGSTAQREVKNFLSIGRDEANKLIVEDLYVSRRHARIERRTDRQWGAGFFIIRDLNSRNGVFLNGARINQAVLRNNDAIAIGGARFRFSFEKDSHKRNDLAARSLNERWNRQLSRLPYIAQSGCPVLLLGPSGSGKEILAQLIHKMSKRDQGPLISLNCSALTESLVESELFGHVKGSYTGAASRRKGAFMAANNGTLFLDEIGDLPLSLQPKLLRAIERGEAKPVGADMPLKTNARIISATHQDLHDKAQCGQFREDLYYRLNVLAIRVPALKERMEDFEPLLQSFAREASAVFSPEAAQTLKNCQWPGNIRELKNTVIRAKAMFASEVIDKEKALLALNHGEGLPQPDRETNYPAIAAELKRLSQIKKRSSPSPDCSKKASLLNDLRSIEKTAITKALRRYKGNQSLSAKALRMPASTFCRRLKEYNIDAESLQRSLLPPARIPKTDF